MIGVEANLVESSLIGAEEGSKWESRCFRSTLGSGDNRMEDFDVYLNVSLTLLAHSNDKLSYLPRSERYTCSSCPTLVSEWAGDGGIDRISASYL
jgi:hypothetical protein